MNPTQNPQTLPSNEPKATQIGIGLLIFSIIALVVIPETIEDPIMDSISYAFFVVFKLWAIFYGQTLVKRLNRNFSDWRFPIYFFTSISLIMLGQLEKLKREPILIDLDPDSNSKNLNGLPAIKLATESGLLLESVRYEPFTLQHMIKNYPNYTQDYSTLFPVVAAYHLNNYNIVFDKDIRFALDKFAKEKNQNSFNDLLKNLSALYVEEISKEFN